MSHAEVEKGELRETLGSSEFLVEIMTTECTETPLAAQKAAKEKTSSKCPAAISSPVGMATRHGGERRL